MDKLRAKYLSDKKFLFELAVSILVLALTLFSLTLFLESVEGRQGVTLVDPLLNLFNPVDVTWFIFLIIYGSLIAGIIYLAAHPQKIIFAVQVYAVLVLIRIFAMYLVALEPPSLMIPLADPFVAYFTTGSVLTKDLFFSGHTATLFFLFLITDKKILRYFFLAGSIAVAILVLLQHVHYSIDVSTAPFFTYAAYRLVLLCRLKINLKNS